MKTEERIIRAALRALANAGYTLWIDDEETQRPVITNQPSTKKLAAEILDLFEATVYAFKGGKAVGWVLFIPSNGIDCLVDYTANLEDALKPVNEMVEQMMEEEA